MVKHMFLQYNCPCQGQHLGQRSKHLTQGVAWSNGHLPETSSATVLCVLSENQCYWQRPTRSDPTPWLTHPPRSPCSTFSGPFPPSAPPLSIFLPQCLVWSFPRSWNDWALPFCQAFGAEGNSLKWSSGQLSLKNHPPEILSCLQCVSLTACQGRARALQLICFLPYCLSSPLEQAMSTVALIFASPFHSGSTWTWYLFRRWMDGRMHAWCLYGNEHNDPQWQIVVPKLPC